MPTDIGVTDPTSQRVTPAEQVHLHEVGLSTSTWFWPILVSLTAVGVFVRLLFVTLARFERIANDAMYFRETAHNLVSGLGYSYPFPTDPAKSVPSAAHPPLFSLVLSLFDLLGLDSIESQRVALAVVSSVAVVLVGLVGRRLLGPTVGVVAAGIAALHPLWLEPVGSLLSESIYLIAIPLVLLMALRALDQATGWRFAALGAAIGVAVLIRSEAILLVVLVGLPVLFFGVVGWKPRLRLAAALLAGCVVLIGPWVIRNEVQLGTIQISTQGGVTLVGSYCPNTFDSHDPSFGNFNGACADGVVALLVLHTRPAGGGEWNEVNLDHALTQDAEGYARGHLNELPRVILAREVSTWFLTGRGIQQSAVVVEGGNGTFEILGAVVFWVLAVPAVVGSVVLWRRSPRRFVILFAPIVMVILNVALTYGSTRFRVAAEPSLAVLAAIGLVAIGRRLHPRSPAGPVEVRREPIAG
jgi:hypothetical protein